MLLCIVVAVLSADELSADFKGAPASDFLVSSSPLDVEPAYVSCV